MNISTGNIGQIIAIVVLIVCIVLMATGRAFDVTLGLIGALAIARLT